MSSSGIYVVFFLLLSNNGDLLSGLATGNVDITACDGSTKDGSVINVKYSEMKSHCNCKIRPQFTGVLKFASNKIAFPCNTEINIYEYGKPEGVLRLACGPRTSGGFNVNSDSDLFMVSKFVNSTRGQFYQEVTIFEEKTFNETISVTCEGNFSTSVSTPIWTANPNATYYRNTTTGDISKTVTRDIQSNDKIDQNLIYILIGVTGIVAALLTVIVLFAVCHLRRKRSDQKQTALQADLKPEQKDTEIYKELPENPLYHSYQPEGIKNQIYAQPTKNEEKTNINDVRKSAKRESSSKEDDCDIVYAKVNK